MGRMAQGDDLGRFSSKYSVHIREREKIISCLPHPNLPQKSILVD